MHTLTLHEILIIGLCTFPISYGYYIEEFSQQDMTILFSHQASPRKSHNIKRSQLRVISAWFYKLQVATQRSLVNTEQHHTFDRIFELFEHHMTFRRLTHF